MRFDLHPFDTLDAACEWAIAQIDGAAGAARARYITITAGQDATYAAKYADALAFVRAGYPDAQLALYPWVQAEMESMQEVDPGVTSQAAADEIKSTGDPWNFALGPKIEKLRMGGKRKIKTMSSIADVVAHVRRVQAELANV